MDTPGIEVHPIITIDGQHHLNRVTFEDVRVPVGNRIGEEGEGWRYANFLLGNERTSYAHVAAKRLQLASLHALAGHDGPLADDADFGRALAQLDVRLDALDIGVLQVLAALADGDAPGNEASMLKILATELAQDITELSMQAAGYPAIARFDNDAPAEAMPRPWATSARARTIYGGTNEIQKNIIAKRVLNSDATAWPVHPLSKSKLSTLTSRASRASCCCRSHCSCSARWSPCRSSSTTERR